MTELLITLMNAPRPVRRATALGVAGLIMVILAVTFIHLVSILSTKISYVEDMRVELFRLNEIIAHQPLTGVAFPDGASATETLFIEGEGLPVLQAKLQERINAIAGASDTTIASISGTSPLQLDGVTYVGVRADVQGSFKAFHDTIHRLETSEPPLIIRQMAIHSTNMFSQGVLSDPLQLAGQITIYGAVHPAIALPDDGRL